MQKLMDFNGGDDDDEQPMELPPGFRFHPTDEELITHYLSPKFLDSGFSCRAVGEVDLNKVEPWDLPWKAKMGEKEWYFFCIRDRKYPTGLRTNRATVAGYWKATGKDREIFREKVLVGMKKTLVFYTGRAPKGEKTNWVMHEYRLEGRPSMSNLNNEWAICRVFKKSLGGKKVHISGLVRIAGDSRLDLPLLEDVLGDDQGLNSKNYMDSAAFPMLDRLPEMKEEFSPDVCCGVAVAPPPSSSYGEMGLKHYCVDQEFPVVPAAAQVDLDCLWDY